MNEEKKQKIELAARRLFRAKVALEALETQNQSPDREVRENQMVQLALAQAEFYDARNELMLAQNP